MNMIYLHIIIMNILYHGFHRISICINIKLREKSLTNDKVCDIILKSISNIDRRFNFILCRCGGIGRHKGLKIP